jgi:hypothetical protein
LRTQVHFCCRWHRRAWVPLLACVGLSLSGCWTLPSADVRPAGGPRVVEGGIEVQHVAHAARVESLDRAARTVVLSVHGVSLPACRVGRGVRNWRDLRLGDPVRATLEEILTVYVPSAEERRRTHADAHGRAVNARVLAVDPSYRLLTLQYPNGGTETFKIGLRTRMGDLQAGDSVAILPVEAVELRVRRHASREDGSRSSRRAGPAG